MEILKIQEKNWENVFLIRDDSIWIRWVKLSLLRREYLWPVVNVLETVLRFCLSLRETFSSLVAFTVINKYGESGVIQISALFDPIYHVACRGILSNTTS